MAEAPGEVVARAAERACPVRLHLRDGEVVVAQVLWHDAEGFAYAALQSSHPERYAVCDSTGVRLAFDAVERAQLVSARPQRP